MHRILFVCHGNICRSTMAEFVLKDMVQRRGEADQFVIASAATSTEEIGNPVHPGTQRALRERGIGGFEKKRARQLRRDDYDQYDLLIGMDEANIRNMTRMLGGDPEGKVHLLLEFAGETSAIVDPWYTGDFEATYRDVAAGCEGLLRELEER